MRECYDGFWYMDVFERLTDRKGEPAEYYRLVNDYLQGIRLDLEVDSIHKKENKEKLLIQIRKKLSDCCLVYDSDEWEEKQIKYGYKYSRYVIVDENGFSKTCKEVDRWTNYEEYIIDLYYLDKKNFFDFN